jgi:hypothetical protein
MALSLLRAAQPGRSLRPARHWRRNPEIRAESDVVLAGIGQYVEFVRSRAADRAGVGRDGAELQAQAREDAAVRLVHVAVFALQVFKRGVEGVAVLHQELAAAHDAEAGANFVAELGLDLIEVNRQLAVALHVTAYDVGDDFLVRRADDEFALVAVLEAQQFRAVLLPAAGFLPQFAGCTAGISSSSAPALFISSRTIFSTLRSTRRPSGIQV